MSGNMLNPWAFESDTVSCTNELFNKLNIKNSTDAIEELKTIDATELIPPIFSDELKINFFGSEQFCFVPTIDDDFVTLPPHISSLQQPSSNVPILIGTTSLESDWMISFESNSFKYPNKNLNIDRFMSEMSQIGMENELFIREFRLTIDMTYGIHKFIQNYVNSTEQENVFLYRFSFDDKFSDVKENVGAVHGDELKYIFGSNFLQEDITRNNLLNKLLTKQRMITLWTNFIEFG